MAQVGGNGVFFGKTVEKDMKKNMWDALTYIRMLTNLRQVPDVTGSGAIMTSKWQKQAEMGFSRKTPLKRHGKEKQKLMRDS